MAVRYAALCRKVHVCHCNSLGGATSRSVMITGRTDRQTDRQSATQYAAPPREEGRIKTESMLKCLANKKKITRKINIHFTCGTNSLRTNSIPH